MTRKVIYISFIRLTDKTSRDWLLDFLIKKGIHVEFWDIVGLVRQSYQEESAKTAKYLKIISSYEELESRIKCSDNKEAIYVILVSYASFTIRFFRLLKKYNCFTMFFSWGSWPIKSKSFFEHAHFIASSPLSYISSFIGRLKTFAYRYFGLVNPFDVLFCAGETLLKIPHHASKVVPINFADYYQFQLNQNVAPIIQGPYAVFLDVFLPFHPDAQLLGWGAVNPEIYYSSLNRFFEILENKYGVKVVVAAHPRSFYGNKNPFNQRQIIFGNTANVVKHSNFVISHSSSSQSYAILNEKPLIFIYTNDMIEVYKSTPYLYEIYDSADYLDATLLNIDNVLSQQDIEIKRVSQDRYDFYKYNFLVSRVSEWKSNEDVFLEEINNRWSSLE